MTKSKYITRKKVAEKLNISVSTVIRWTNNNEFPLPFALGPNRIVWDETEIDEFINEKKKLRGFHGHKPRDKTCHQ